MFTSNFYGVRIAYRFSFLCCVVVFLLCLVFPMLPVSLSGLPILDCIFGFL